MCISTLPTCTLNRHSLKKKFEEKFGRSVGPQIFDMYLSRYSSVALALVFHTRTHSVVVLINDTSCYAIDIVY